MSWRSDRVLLETLDKVVTAYFRVLTKEPFTYKKYRYVPNDVVVSPQVFSGYTCPANCGGCCVRFSLDYLPSEWVSKKMKPLMKRRVVEFNGNQVILNSYTQEDHKSHYCRFLNHPNGDTQEYDVELEPGRCQVHGFHPFSCDVELLRFSVSNTNGTPHRLSQRLYGRGHDMLRVDGVRGARCEIITGDETWRKDVRRRLARLRDWCEHFRLNTHIDEVIRWVDQGPHERPLRLMNTFNGDLGLEDFVPTPHVGKFKHKDRLADRDLRYLIEIGHPIPEGYDNERIESLR